MAAKPCHLIITDIDNTLFNWINYYAKCYSGLVRYLSETFQLPYEKLVAESAAVFEKHGSTEYPFVVQELPSIVAQFQSVDDLINQAVEPARQRFLEIAREALIPYPGVKDTLRSLRQSGIKLVALTDAPCYVALWKLNKLNLLDTFDAIYGLPDPRIPTTADGAPKVHPTILMKYLRGANFGFTGHIRTLPENYEKPDPKGLKTVLMDFNLDSAQVDRKSIIWIGDNPKKDMWMGHQLGLTNVWAEYGIKFNNEDKVIIDAFSSGHILHRNVSFGKSLTDEIRPDHIIQSFPELLNITR